MKNVYRIVTALLLLVGSQGQSYGQSAYDKAVMEKARFDLEWNRTYTTNEATDTHNFAMLARLQAESQVTEAHDALNAHEIENGAAALNDNDFEVRILRDRLSTAETNFSIAEGRIVAAQSYLSITEAVTVSLEALIDAGEAAIVSGDTATRDAAMVVRNALIRITNVAYRANEEIKDDVRILDGMIDGGRLVRSSHVLYAASIWGEASLAAFAAERAHAIMDAMSSGADEIPPELLEPIPEDLFA